ncbi:hypothetical protein JCM6882_008403 [Rhodosporidiobolus microsporus]
MDGLLDLEQTVRRATYGPTDTGSAGAAFPPLPDFIAPSLTFAPSPLQPLAPRPNAFTHDILQPQARLPPTATFVPHVPTIQPFFLHRSPSAYSLSSSVSDNEHPPPSFFDSLPSASGAQRRTPAYQAARENSGPYSRRSSVSSFGGRDDVKLPPFLDGGAGVGLADRMAGLKAQDESSEEEVKREEDEEDVKGEEVRRGGGRHPKRFNTASRLDWATLKSSQQKSSCTVKSSSLSSAAGPSQVAVDPFSGASDGSGDSDDGQVDTGSYEETQEALAGAAEAVLTATTATATDKARGAFVQIWLSKSYEITEGSSVARQALFGSYVEAAERFKVKPLNSASFGKAAKQAFPTLKTRRLGTRGHSRYHLMNLAASNPVEAAQVARIDDELKLAQLGGGGGGAEREEGSSASEASVEEEEEGMKEDEIGASISIPSGDTSDSSGFDAQKTLNAFTKTAVPLHPHLTLAPPPVAAPVAEAAEPLPSGFPSEGEVLEEGRIGGNALPEEAVREVWASFAGYCGSVLKAVKKEDFGRVGTATIEWWTSPSPNDMALLQHSSIVPLVTRAVSVVFQTTLLCLHDNLEKPLSPEAPASLQQLADQIEDIHSAALAAYAQDSLVVPLFELAARFSHLLNLHLGLRKLVHALGGLLANSDAKRHLAQSWVEVDFAFLKKQAALANTLDLDLLSSAFAEFHELLTSPEPLTVAALASWLETRCNRFKDEVGSPQEVLQQWSWVTGQVLRDLTLRSSPSFGSFQVINLFLQDLLTFQILLDTAFTAAPAPTPLPVPPPAPFLRAYSAPQPAAPPPPQAATAYLSSSASTAYRSFAPPSPHLLLPLAQPFLPIAPPPLPVPPPFFLEPALEQVPAQAHEQLLVQVPPPFPSPSSTFFFHGGGGNVATPRAFGNGMMRASGMVAAAPEGERQQEWSALAGWDGR